MKTLLLSLLFVTAVHAAEPVRVVHDVTTIFKCTAIATVKSAPTHLMVSGAEKDIAKQTAALGGDTVLVIDSNGFILHAMAYRCGVQS